MFTALLLLAHTAYNNVIGLSETLNNVSSNYWVTRQTLNDYINSNNIITSSLSSSIQTNKNNIDIINACLTNVSANYWKTNSSVQTITSRLTTTFAWVGNVSLYANNVCTTTYNLSNAINALSSCLASVSTNFWSTKQNFNTISCSLISTTNWLQNVSLESDNAWYTLNNLSQTVNNISGVVYTVNNMLANVSLTASRSSSDILNVNLSLTNVSGRCYALENTQTYTILPKYYSTHYKLW